MKKQFPYAIAIILAVGAVMAVAIMRMNTSFPVKMGEHAPSESKQEDAVPRGPHGGWLFSKDAFQMEVAIFERGVPPQFRVYPMDTGGNPIELNEVQLVIELHRLDRMDTPFKYCRSPWPAWRLAVFQRCLSDGGGNI